MTILLNYYKAKLVDREEFLQEYSAISGYKMLNGTPLIVNVEGSCVKASDIPELLVSRRYSKQVNDWLMELRNPINVGKIKLEFKWRR